MNVKVFLIACVLTFVAQINLAAGGGQDPRLRACAHKLIEQIGKVHYDKVPSCYDISKLAQAKKDTEVFQNFYETIPDNCKKPKKENIKECLKTIRGLVDKHSDSMKTGIFNSLTSLFQGAKQCIDNLKHVYQNLDKYVLNGCQGNI